MNLKIGILGTRGIPNRYGGFEQCAEYLALGLIARGHEVWVYSAHNHEYSGDEWKGVQIIHCKDPEDKMGTFGQFIYDLNCIKDARRRAFDILLQLGYTSNSVWFRVWPKYCSNVVNMDGLEWKRSKYNKYVRKFLKTAERWAAEHGDVLIADSTGIQQHLLEAYNRQSHFIPYGAEIFEHPDVNVLQSYDLEAYKYHLLIARMEPENNIETIIKGYLGTAMQHPLVIVGKTGNTFGMYLVNKYGQHEQIRFLGGIYDAEAINNLRYYSFLYFHGHSVGGTNPSLLEAMACKALIVAHDNVFNKSVLGKDAFYFSSDNELAAVVGQLHDKQEYTSLLSNNTEKIRAWYNWARITDSYEKVFLEAVKNKGKR